MIDLDRVSCRYGDTVVVDGVSLHVEAGEVLVLLGGSGAGKTTALKMINRLVEPTAGTIRVAGEDVRAVVPHALRRRIGYVFQRLGLFPHMSVADNIGITPHLLGWPAERVRARIDALLELVELDPATTRARYPHQLSGGQAQRVAVARALAAEPPVLLLDEPFGALDVLTRERLWASFNRIRRQLHLTAIFVTHDMVEAMFLGDRVAVMRSGRLLQVGPIGELVERPVDAYVAELVGAPARQARLVAQRLGRLARSDGEGDVNGA